MEEKVLIQSEQYNVKKFFKIMVIIGAVLSILVFAINIADNMGSYDYYYRTYLEHQEAGSCGKYFDSWESCYRCEAIKANSTKLAFGIGETLTDAFYMFISAIPIAALTLLGGLIYFWLRGYELTVTDKRIYGKVAWGKRVDLPVDSISATATTRLLKGITVSTSSGRISFLVIKNAEDIYQVISELLIKRQGKKQNSLAQPSFSEVVMAEQTPNKPKKKNSLGKSHFPEEDAFEQIKKYKELLDMGIITQEEFDLKKKQLLDL